MKDLNDTSTNSEILPLTSKLLPLTRKILHIDTSKRYFTNYFHIQPWETSDKVPIVDKNERGKEKEVTSMRREKIEMWKGM